MKRKHLTARILPGPVLIAVLTALAESASAEPAGGRVIAGTRLGLSDGAQVSHVDAFADWRLPWGWAWENGLAVQTYAASSLGWLGDGDEDAVTGSFGPCIRLTYNTLPIAIVGGSSPTFIGRNRFGARNMGSAFQFTSHIGVAWAVAPRFELGYRFQHMSNAGIDDDNPGLNSHMVTLAWRF